MVPKPPSDKAFADWRHAACTLLIASGIAVSDLPDLDWHRAFDLGLTPVAVASEIIAFCTPPEIITVDPAELDRIAVA